MSQFLLTRLVLFQTVAFLLVTVASSSHAAGLPDTGQTNCYSTYGTTDCMADASFPRQDGSQGTAPAYTKLGAAGNPVEAGATEWSCVRDEATGLTWEAKTTDGSLRDASHRHAWYLGDAGSNGGDPGASGDTASCAGTLGGQTCSTANFIAAINAANYCGASDWRLPTQMELLTLVHAGRVAPSIDTTFFPDTANAPHWSATTHAMNRAFAWGVNFGYGAAHAESKATANAVRLVRGTWVK